MQENQKVSKIIEEVTLFFLEQGASDLNIRIKKERLKVSLIFDCKDITQASLEQIRKGFKQKRQQYAELYGWELLGQGDLDHEWELISTLIDYCSYFFKEERFYLNLVRYEKS